MEDFDSASLIEGGEPSEDPKAFRRTLGQFATGVTVIATEHQGRPVGVTANSFSSLSLDPPLILWSIARTSRSFSAFSAASHFCVSILGEYQIDVSQKLSSSKEDKFCDVSWRSGIGGSPVIAGAIATLECSTFAVHDGGDHIILIGRVLQHRRYPGRALLYAQGQYGVADEHPALRAQATTDPKAAQPARSLRDLPLTTLLYLAHHNSSAAFERHRREENISLTQSRILSALTRHSSLSRQAIVRQVYMTPQTVDDALSELLQRKCLNRDDDDRFGLSEAGQMLAHSIRMRLQEYEREQFAGIPADKLDIARDVLARFIDGLAEKIATDDAA
ncbi:flavin reductase [Xaviernesmea oryzae]|uniref:NADH-FMN oxidoreductase RutF, flavin reductase (DIM6/NTAB) family n=1 Tax=Xaviernesmea oryzae TaxID=464029 RepID=A0A1X7DUZ9_9HYPH|nr:flavin reductase [Xaviernesmea oryzae]SMF22102.1 NADH-FMN oxidoreductase RutF, flavin reductase (DIM6/NTAB) family [Xaviernesmea oryzae]